MNELLALRRAGKLSAIFATKPDDRTALQPGGEELDSLVTVLDDGDPDGQGAQVAAALAGADVNGVHGYFAHRPTEVARAAAARLGVPYGFSVHALDVRKVPQPELARRCREAAVVVCCNDETARSIRAAGGESVLVRHGVDLGRFTAGRPPREAPVELLAVGRLVEKKGFDVLIHALSLADRPFRLQIIGEGDERGKLEAAVARSGLAGDVQLVGHRTHTFLPAAYADTDIVVVPSVVDANGDRDGLPNVVLEAMASGRAIVASDVAAIPAAITHGLSGVLVAPGDPFELARELTNLIDRPDERRRLGKAARAEVELHFSLEACTAHLVEILERSYG